jgi:hypothetical protein
MFIIAETADKSKEIHDSYINSCAPQQLQTQKGEHESSSLS